MGDDFIGEGFTPELDAFIEMLGYKLEEERTHILNPKRVVEMETAYNTISKIVLSISPDAEIKCHLSELTPAHAVIDIVTDELIVQDIRQFITGIENANNFEIYPLKKGKMCIAIMFHGIMTELPNA